MPPTPHCGDQSHQTSWSIVLLFELFTTCVEFQLCCLVPKTTSCCQETPPAGEDVLCKLVYRWRKPLWRICCSRSESWKSGPNQVGPNNDTFPVTFSHTTARPFADRRKMPDLVWMGITRMTLETKQWNKTKTQHKPTTCSRKLVILEHCDEEKKTSLLTRKNKT